MADPLSILGAAAAIQQFVEAAGKIIQYAYGYAQKYRNASVKASQLAQELRALVCILTEINEIVSSRSGQQVQSFVHLGPLIQAAKIDVLQILSELPQDKFGRRQRIVWPFTEEKTDKLIEVVSDRLARIHVAVELEHLRVSDQTWLYVNALQSSFKAWTVDQSQIAENDNRAKILRWISFTQFRSLRFQERHNDKRAIRHPTTGISLLTNETYTKWKAQQFYGQESWLWAIGEAGSRKSTVMSVVVDDLIASQSSDDMGMAVVYCQYEFTDTVIEQTLTHILGNMISQLLHKQSRLPYALESAYSERFDGGEPSLNLVVELFMSAVQSLESSYLVVDGLDELGTRERPALLEVFDRLDQERVKILISSRPHPFELKGRLPEANVLKVFPQKAEIAAYLADEIANNDKLQVKIEGDPTVAEYLVQEISSRTGHSFTFAVAMLGNIQAGISKAQVIKLLESSRTPDDVFGSTMKRILQQQEKEDAITILGWLVYARTPLTLEQLRVAMAVSAEGGYDKDMTPAQEIILDICGGLIQVQPSSGIVKLTHLTTRDFLVKHPAFEPQHMESRLARTCIQYLMSPEFSTICVLKEDIIKRERDNPLAIYAASYWGVHAWSAQESGLEQLILTFALQAYASSAFQLSHFRPDDIPVWASSVKYRSSLYQSPIPASYLCAYFRLIKSQTLLTELEPGLIDAAVTWGAAFSPLHLAVLQKDLEMLELLLRQKVDLTHQDQLSLTATFRAVQIAVPSEKVTLQILHLLLVADSDNAVAKMVDRAGHTALHFAIHEKPISVIKILLEHGYDPNATTKNQQTEIHSLVRSDRVKKDARESGEIVKLLLKYGADPTLKDDQGMSVLYTAVSQGLTGIVQVLREAPHPGTGKSFEFSQEDIELSDALYQENLGQQTATAHMLGDKHLKTQEQRLTSALERLLKIEGGGSGT